MKYKIIETYASSMSSLRKEYIIETNRDISSALKIFTLTFIREKYATAFVKRIEVTPKNIIVFHPNDKSTIFSIEELITSKIYKIDESLACFEEFIKNGLDSSNEKHKQIIESICGV